MNLRTTLVLMILFMGLGSIAFFDPFRLEEKKNREEDAEKQVFSIQEKVVQEISIRNGARSVKLACAAAEGCKLDGEASWKVIEPVQDEGDASAIATLANAVVNLRTIEKVPLDAPMDPKEFGFEQGRPALEMKTKEGVFRLETGSPTAVGPNVYLRVPGETQTLYIVAAYFPQMLDKEVFHWRNKRLFPGLESEKIAAISWKGRETSLEARKEKGKWRIESPIQAPANFIMMEGLASTLAYTSAKAILTKAPGKPELEIEFSGGKIALSPRKDAPKGSRELVAAVGGKYFVVDAAPFDRFRKGMLEYRERRLFPEVESVEELELFFPRENKRVKLKKNGAWQVVGGEIPTEPLSQDRLDALAGALASGEASAFLPASNPGARQFKRHKPDVEVILPGDRKAHFLVAERKMALTEGIIPGEVRAFTGPFLAALPIRLADLYASHNKLAPQIKKEEDGHDHSHEH
jgi:hypothetical protein